MIIEANPPTPPDPTGPAFVPCTREIDIGNGVVYRPLRSWHSGIFAGEGLTEVGGDASGCIRIDSRSSYVAPRPGTVVHRLYWNKLARGVSCVSAFLSYPNAMGACSEYFWEAYIGEEPERFTGPDAETEMERAIVFAIGGEP